MGSGKRELPTLEPIGLEMGAEQYTRFLQERDPCFGRHFAKTVEACKRCRAPVIMEGQVYLLLEVCRGVSEGQDRPHRLNRLTSQDVFQRLQEGATTQDIFEEILAQNDPDVAAVAARQILARRLRYLERKHEVPVPDLPKTEQLKEEVE